jgi:plasmid stabilization system protein ParE
MVEVVWKQGAENDLMEVFSRLEEWREGNGARFVRSLDVLLQHIRMHPKMAPVFDRPMRRMVIGNSGYGIFYTVEMRGIIVMLSFISARTPRRFVKESDGFLI